MKKSLLIISILCLFLAKAFAADVQIQGRDSAKKRYLYVQIDTLGYLVLHPTLTFPQDSVISDTTAVDSLVFSTPLTGFQLWSNNGDINFWGINTKYADALPVEIGGSIRATEAVVNKIYFSSAVGTRIYLWGTQK